MGLQTWEWEVVYNYSFTMLIIGGISLCERVNPEPTRNSSRLRCEGLTVHPQFISVKSEVKAKP